jgi:enoyl-CoA hydratase/carnithine racemase
MPEEIASQSSPVAASAGFDRSEVSDRVAVITLARPPVNAISQAMAEELAETFASLAARPDVQAFVLTGGDDRFSAGMDIKELLAENLADPTRAVPTARRFHAIFRSISALRQPVIAAVNGYALGGAFMRCLYCDIRVAAADATFALPEIKLGSVPSFGLPRVLRLAGPGFAKRLVLSGEQITAHEAYNVRLIDELTEPGAAQTAALRLARRIAQMPVLATFGCKEALSYGSELPLESAQQRDWQIADRVARTEDRNECLKAFMEKREPRLVGR